MSWANGWQRQMKQKCREEKTHEHSHDYSQVPNDSGKKGKWQSRENRTPHVTVTWPQRARASKLTTKSGEINM